MFRSAFIFFCRRSRSHQITKGFMLRVGNPDRGERATLVALGESLRVAPVGLDALSSFFRDERWGHHLALDAQLRELPVQRVAGGSRLVANLQTVGSLELFDELSH